jgi:arginyl-tRNA synthetase
MTALLKFKNSIANQLSKRTPCSPKDITTFMRPSKQRKDGHISISLPKLNASLVDPTPKQELAAWTQSIAEKVLHRHEDLQ